ncbi:MAG: GWxTD domain-containing protein [Ignavibacteriae bacterium]|nr:GWxTD domain-containing protein [Ignavibacteriota bacterium]MCB9210865.1 GWxTD domain-containing protein [Ignavibacteriales bacterium]MCB9217839.1 GWxTD domain-containing protein [Ignavibacteriales bacterium]
MRKIFLLLLISFLNVTPQNKINFEFDFAQFKYDSTSNYLEIYYSLSMKEKNPNSNENLLMHIQMQNTETDELIINKDWMLKNNKIDEKDSQQSSDLLGTVAFIVKKGKYNFYISVSAENNDKVNVEYNEQIEIHPYNNSTLSISSIELANRIINENADQNSIFYKNTLEVFPNPAILYSKTSPVLFYYCELYNLDNSKSDYIEIKQNILNSKNQSVYEKTKQISSKQPAVVEVGAINLLKYPTDTYTLIVTLNDPNSVNNFISGKKFFFVNPDVIASNSNNTPISNYMSSEFGVFSDEECDILFGKSKIIASSDEIKQYEKLDSLSSKREFLFKFWQKRDNNPETSINEFKNVYLQRVELANNRFKTMTTSGYSTDRGRIFLRLGEPDEIDRHPNETNTKPYEIWYYNQIEGGVYFIFGDVTGFNYYQLLHSTMRGELQDPDWVRRIQTK